MTDESDGVSGISGSGERPVLRVEVPAGQGVQVGDGGTQTNVFIGTYIAEQRAVPVVPAAGHVVAGEVPQRPAAFQARSELLEEIRLGGPGVAVVQAVTGMRGVGKTQVAAAYARSCIEAGWRLVAWVNAGDTARVLNGLAMVASRLGIGDPGDDAEVTAGVLRNWLEANGEQCLVVFDNVTDVNGLRPFLPAAGKTQVVITSTEQTAADLGIVIPVDVFSEAEALAFLTQRIRRHDDDGARVVARELGWLPLALSQAAAVIAGQRLPYATYLERLRSLPVQEYLVPARSEPYPHGVAEAVLMSVDAVAAIDKTGLCRGILNVVSLLSTAGVSRTLLYGAGDAGVFPTSGSGDTAGLVDEALGQLAEASLIVFSVDDSTVSAHRLVMRVARERCAHERTLNALVMRVSGLLDVVTQSLGEPLQNRPAARDMIEQVTALHENLAPYLQNDQVLARRLLSLREWALWCMNDLGDSFTQAIEYGEPLITDAERLLGCTHPNTINCRSNLAIAYRAAGRLDEAIPLYEQVLADRERILGDTHPDTLDSRNNLADAYHMAGRLDEAIPLLEQALADSERVLGDTHPHTLDSRNNLAAIYRVAGRLDQAIPLLELALADSEQIMGNSHPHTLIFRCNLADAYRVAGRVDEAIPLLEQALADSDRIMGSTHPEILTWRARLAIAYRVAGRLDEAIPLYEQVLADCERILGDTHPHTLSSRNNLAFAYRSAGRADEAIPLYEQTLADRERILGDTHPHTLSSRNNLADAYQAVGRLVEADDLRSRTEPES